MGKENYVSVPLYDHEAVYPVKAPKTAVVVKKSSSRSCCCSPCMKILIGLFVVFIVVPFVLFGAVVVATYAYVAKEVKSVTVTERRVLPIVQIPESELEMAMDRISLFWDDLAAGRTPANDLILTADEINGFIAESDYLRGNAFVRLDENQFTFVTSLPLDSSFLPGGQGRYFVSTTSAAVTTTNDEGEEDTQLTVDVDAPVSAHQGKLATGLFDFGMDDDKQHHVIHLLYGKAFGAEPCDKFYQEHHNLLDFLYDGDDDDDVYRVIDNLAAIKFLNNKIVFTARHPDDVHIEGSTETTSRLSPWNLLRRLF